MELQFGPAAQRPRGEAVTPERVDAPTTVTNWQPSETPALAASVKASTGLSLSSLLSSLNSQNADLRRLFEEAYRNHPIVFAAVAQQATMLCEAPLELGTKTAGGSFVTLPQTDSLVSQFEMPHRCYTWEDTLFLTWTWMQTVGECFWILERPNPGAEATSIMPVAGGVKWKRLTEADPTDGCPRDWLYQYMGQEIPYADWEVVHFKHPNPFNPDRGLAPLAAARATVEVDGMGRKFQRSLLANNGRVGGVIEFPEDAVLTPGQEREFRAALEDRHAGPDKAGRFLILKGGAKYSDHGAAPADMQYLEGLEFDRDEILAVLGWNRFLLGIPKDANRGDAVELRAQAWEQTLSPGQRRLLGAIRRQYLSLIRGGRITARFNNSQVPAIRAHRRSLLADAETLLRSRVSLQQANEYLGLELEAEEGWEVPMAPIGITPVADLLDPPEPPPPPTPPLGDPEADDDADQDDAPPEDDGDDDEMPEDDSEESKAIRHQLRVCDAHYAGAKLAAANGGALWFPAEEKVPLKQRRKAWRQWMQKVRVGSDVKAERVYTRFLRDYRAAQMERFDEVARTIADRQRITHMAGIRTKEITAEDIDQILLKLPEVNSELRAAVRPLFFEIGEVAMAYTLGELGPNGTGDTAAPRVLRYLDERVQSVTWITEDAHNILADTLAAGIANQETLTEIRLRMEQVLGSKASRIRSQRVARTEVGGVTNGLRTTMHLESGYTRHSWVSAGDEVTRTEHLADDIDTNADPIVIGSPFPNTQLMMPQDPSGPPGQVINCRCMTIPAATIAASAPTQADKPVSLERFLAILREGAK